MTPTVAAHHLRDAPPRRAARLSATSGLPGSEKSTWATALAAATGAVRVNRDELRAMLHGGRRGALVAESQVTVVQEAAIEALLRRGVDVISDDTNLLRAYVQRLAELAARCGAEFVHVERFLAVPLAECIRRDAGRSGPARVGERVIRQLYAEHRADVERNGAH